MHFARGQRNDTRPIELYCERDGVWTAKAVFETETDLSTVRFGISSEYTPVEWQRSPRKFPIPPTSSERGPVLILEDANERIDDPLHSAAFTNVVFRRHNRMSQADVSHSRDAVVKKAAEMDGVATVFGVRAPRVSPDHAVYILGNIPALGGGNAENAVPLSDADAPLWSVCLPLQRTDITNLLEYRFIIKDSSGNVVTVEQGVRLLNVTNEDLGDVKSGTAPVVCAYANSGFRYTRKWRGAGIALPVFSIRSDSSCGVGEFNDLIKVVDLCVATGQQLLQLLPVNDTTCYRTARDSYPYSAVSCFALHPQYLNIESLGELPADLRAEYNAERTRLNALPEIDYEDMMRVKARFIKVMYALQKQTFLQSPEFTEWFAEHQQWLVPYALYRFFTEVNGTSEYDKWGERVSLTPEEMEQFAAPDSFHFDYLGVVYYTQFHLDKQLTRASQYAAEREVIFKGDLPIGVNRYCADTWLNPHLFHLNMQAGAPPDYFSQDGQNWGFPTYNWEAMKADGYAWWRLRLGHMARYFHAYRIDHILGFFRIWEIPAGMRTGMSGRFRPVYGLGREELESRGLWDFDRYTMPYVRDAILEEMIGEGWFRVKERFFETMWEDRLKFKDEYNTERKVDKALELADDAPEYEKEFNEKVRAVLTKLQNNVCLLRDVDDEDIFHPRYMVTTTSSFQELASDDWKRILSELHEDYFFRRQDALWRTSAMEKLPMMKEASDMLVCGEDLGLVPACVESVMETTGILSLAVQRMPDGDTEFGIPSTYKYECVASTSSHDVSTVRGWWGELDDGARQRYWTNILHRCGGAPKECSGELVEEMLASHMKSPAMWVITPIQDLLGMDELVRRRVATDEQINDPSNPLHIWKFRLHLSVEQILANPKLIMKMRSLNREYGRGEAY